MQQHYDDTYWEYQREIAGFGGWADLQNSRRFSSQLIPSSILAVVVGFF